MGTPGAKRVIEELTPTPDPWETARRLAGLPHLLFLDGCGTGDSFVAADPVRWISSRTDDAAPATFDDLRGLIQENRTDHLPGLPPFQGGVAGLFGYDLCHLTERLPRPNCDEFRLPDLAVGVYEWVMTWSAGRCWVIAPNAEALRKVLSQLCSPSSICSRLPPRVTPRVQHPLAAHSKVYSSYSRAGFESAVARAVEYTHAGDCFQVNLAQRLLAPAADPLALYGRLRERNPAPFAGYLDLGDYAVVSSSPEQFLRVDPAGHVRTRPIKGTRPRGRDAAEDAALKQQLLNSEKDRAENVMIVDLLRNDLGKVSAYGSIHVTKVCELETHPTVHHLVSEVVGRLRAGTMAVDLLRGAFPGGSVTGAPKVRAMEIIAELEPVARGPYCGCLGYLGFDGAMDTSILIRTMTVGGGWAQFPVGAGIVADSDPAAEYEETLAKAEGMLRALG